MAVKIFKEKLKQAPDNGEILFKLGMTYHYYYLLDNSTKRAWRYLTKVLKINPANFKAAFGLADILKYEKREYELAITYYDKFIQFEAANAEYYLERGEYSQILKYFDHAFRNYAKGMSLQQDHWQRYNRWGFEYAYMYHGMNCSCGAGYTYGERQGGGSID